MPIGPDGKNRCFGTKPDYMRYHDEEWGVPVHDDTYLFEMLTLEGAQAGLSWETVLAKRASYRDAFFGYDIRRIAAMSDEEIEALMHNAGLIRNRLKLFSVRKNALAFMEIQREAGSFAAWLWAHVGGAPIVTRYEQQGDVPAETPLSREISKALKKRGMSFVGPTIIYAYLQGVGVVNDHIASCWKA